MRFVELYLIIIATFCIAGVLLTTPCYNAKNNPVFCNPEFANIVQNYRASLSANSTCGSSLEEEKVCPVFFSVTTTGALEPPVPPYSKAECELCDSRSVVENRQHPVEHITKATYFGSGNQLCWMSQPGEKQPVMVEIDFGKLMDALYMVLRFCNEPATDIAIYKTSDFGASWYPIHYINENCKENKGIDPDKDVVENQPSCGPLQKQQNQLFGLYSAAHNQRNYDDRELQSRKLATGFRVVFHGYAPETDRDDSYQFFSLSSMEIGGQCQCNGHASSCKSDGARIRCECEHNTYGSDCESCHPFYQDLPWRPATAERGFECKKCSCSGHSDECYFDQDIFDESGEVSGGVCLNCKDNTRGRFCHECAEGYYRTPNEPIDSKNACTKCGCHEAGSLHTDRCHPITGQCMCKVHVIGRNCGSCQDGYKISADNEIPCVKEKEETKLKPPKKQKFDLDEEEATTPAWWKKDASPGGMPADEPVCQSKINRVLKFDAYCKYEMAMRVTMTSFSEKTADGKFHMHKLKVTQHLYSTSGGRLPDEILVSVPSDVAGSCINFDKNTDYYILANNWARHMRQASTVYSLTADDTVLKVKDSLRKKMAKFRQKQVKQNKC
ncbi:netrin-1-like [Convolutriloba macropyga]|uniref:netrin-1-like n=1 Tax=Convolutriloba macropyga TaxID=536237 RepID=UPI003F525A6D